MVDICDGWQYAAAMNHDAAATALGALGNPVRLEVYRTLVRAGKPGLSIASLQERLGGVPRSTLAHHLGKLLHADLITQEKDGASVISHAGFDLMAALVAYLTEECCADEAQRCETCVVAA